MRSKEIPFFNKCPYLHKKGIGGIMKVTKEKEINKIIQILKEEKDSPIKEFLDESFPKNDIEYLQLWFRYFGYIYSEYQTGAIENLLSNMAIKPSDFEFHFYLRSKIKQMLKKSLDKKLNNLKFTPRLIKYIRQFDKPEKDYVKNIILAYLYFIWKDDMSYKSLVDLTSQFSVPFNYVLSLTLEHPLFQDKIIRVNDDSLNSDKPLPFKDIVFNSVIYNIFAGIGFNGEDIAGVVDSPLLDLFNIREEYGLEMESESEHLEDTAEEIDEEINIKDIGELLKLEERDVGDTEGKSEDEEEVQIEVKERELRAFENDLEYLYNEYLRIKYMTKAIEVRSDDIRYDGIDAENKIFKMRQRVKKQENICKIRLEKSKKRGFIPRLEKIADRLNLREFEKDILKTLTVKKVFLDPKEQKSYGYFDTTNANLTVGSLLNLLAEDPLKRVQEKKAFLKTSRLVRANLIQLEKRDGLNQNLYDCEVIIDNRLIEYLIGEDYDISDYLEGGYMYHPKISLDDVVLPQETKNSLLKTITSFPDFLEAKNKLEFSEVVEYGNALTMLFVGPSGTGKTMLANAIANYLGKKILLFNFHNISQLSDATREGNVFSVLFRESRINDAVLFFDEAEDILRNRINDLLIEIEKHEGIVIFATNASFKIDEAMRRRINLVLHFQNPGPALRKKIWEVHLPEKLKMHDNIDLEKISRKFEINGGLIKNAVFSSLSHAVNERDGGELVLKMEHLDKGAREQLSNKLYMSRMEEQKSPIHGFESLVLSEDKMNTLNQIVNIEKARKVLNGEWGFDKVFPDQNGISVLFHGPPGTGKTLAAEAIAFESGKNLKVINYAEVLSMWLGETEKNLDALFKDVAENDSVLLFDEADALFAKRSSVLNSNDRYANLKTDVLLSLIEKNNTFAILTTNYLENIDEAFFRRFRYILEFEKPDKRMRIKLWKTLLPEKLPLSDDVDLKKLAERYEFTGGDIKNVIIKAATRRAVSIEESREVMMDDFVEVSEETIKTKTNEKTRDIGFAKVTRD